jgi:hypothetical protein
MDAILPSWDRIDSLAEKYYNISPYAYCADNPVNSIDPIHYVDKNRSNQICNEESPRHSHSGQYYPTVSPISTIEK